MDNWEGDSMREYLINLAIHCKGNYLKMEGLLVRQTAVPHYDCTDKTLTIMDTSYPKWLLDLEHPPLVLFYCGDISLLNQVGVGVIGSRQPSAYALRMTRKLVKKVRGTLVIISGLAYGIDSVAHYEALNYRTVAVLGCGLDVYYPLENRELQDRIGKKHCLISEYPRGTRPQKYHFPVRNRIIAALAQKIYIMAAEIKSGTMTTVDHALILNREVICLPHNLDERAGAGCNLLIRDGASVLTNI